MHDQLSLNLQEFFDNASEEGVELLSEVHAAMYEVEDGVLPEEEYRRALHTLIQDQTKAAQSTGRSSGCMGAASTPFP
jgi:hypothetical protein